MSKRQHTNSDAWELLRGWQAARKNVPLDPNEDDEFIEGWKLYKSSHRTRAKNRRGTND